MNSIEKRILEILKRGKDEYGFIGIKSEFEAEGTRMDELLRLIELVWKANLNLVIKIGGCEAISDLHNCKLLGANHIIAPMIETSYSLSKYIDAKNKVFTLEEQKDILFLFNLETITAYNDMHQILETASSENGVDGVVFGRVDFSASTCSERSETTSDKMTKYCINVAKACKKYGMEYVIGGAVTMESIDSLKKIRNVFLTRFETRKVVFNSEILNGKENLFLKSAIEFELLALKNKHNYYSIIANEDINRIIMLETRLTNL